MVTKDYSMDIPRYSVDLIELLEKEIPDVFPSNVKTLEEFHELKGKIELVRMLKYSIQQPQQMKDK